MCLHFQIAPKYRIRAFLAHRSREALKMIKEQLDKVISQKVRTNIGNKQVTTSM